MKKVASLSAGLISCYWEQPEINDDSRSNQNFQDIAGADKRFMSTNMDSITMESIIKLFYK